VQHTGSADAVLLRLHDPAGQLLAEHTQPLAASGATSHTFDVPHPALWWPHGLGAQPRYHVSAELLRSGTVADTRALHIGVRSIRLDQGPVAGERGSAFTFVVNGRPMFISGANWIPADNFLPRIDAARYRAWVQRALHANFSMLRVWGGGIYEDDAFYDACDELGVLVWQDFGFGCGLYPADDAFVACVRREAEDNVRRLRHHASLALWCGNNEDYTLAESLNRHDPAERGDLRKSRFPARYLYERTLPDVVRALDPDTAYWPGSPYTPGGKSQDGSIGDRHTWDIWHGNMAPYQDYAKFIGRFVSEFGMMGWPVRETAETFYAPDETRRSPYSASAEHHNKAEGGVRRMANYVSDNLGAPTDASLESHIYFTQLMQAEALTAAYAQFRRGWGGPGRRACSGALVWQLDDCWPVSSWAIIDDQLRAKPALYALRRMCAPVAIGTDRRDGIATSWLCNDTRDDLPAVLSCAVWSLHGTRIEAATRELTCPANNVLELGAWPRPLPADAVLALRLSDRNGRVLARAAAWPRPLKHQPPVGVPQLSVSGDVVQLRAEAPVKGAWLTLPGHPLWDDNLIDLMPDDVQTLRCAQHVDQAALRVTHYV
jgi:beta-mannosidase